MFSNAELGKFVTSLKQAKDLASVQAVGAEAYA
jgi:hypothetical protein